MDVLLRFASRVRACGTGPAIVSDVQCSVGCAGDVQTGGHRAHVRGLQEQCQTQCEEVSGTGDRGFLSCSPRTGRHGDERGSHHAGASVAQPGLFVEGSGGELGIKYDTLRKAIEQGRLRQRLRPRRRSGILPLQSPIALRTNRSAVWWTRSLRWERPARAEKGAGGIVLDGAPTGLKRAAMFPLGVFCVPFPP